MTKKSMIGTRNGGPSGASQEARDRFADALLAQGEAWGNTAGNIRVGFENVWITPGLIAIEKLLRERPIEDEE